VKTCGEKKHLKTSGYKSRYMEGLSGRREIVLFGQSRRKSMRRVAFDSTLASKIFESRQALLTLWGEKYGEKIEEYKDIILEVRTQTRESVLQAVQRILKSIQWEYRESPAQIAFLAAAVDLIDESS